MNFRLINACFLVIIFFNIAFSQHSSKDLVLLEQFYEPNCESLLYQMDILRIELKEKNVDNGFVVIYGGLNRIENEYYRRSISEYLKSNNLDKIKLLTNKQGRQLRIETWIGKNGAKPNINQHEFSLKLPQKQKPIVFSKVSLEYVIIDKKATYLINGCEVCCFHTFNPYLLSDFLSANPHKVAQIKIKAHKLDTAKKLRSILLKEFISESLNLSKRTKIVPLKFSKEEFTERKENINIADIEVLLLPR